MVTSSRASSGGASCALRSPEKGWAGGRGHSRSVGRGSQPRDGAPVQTDRRAPTVSTTYREWPHAGQALPQVLSVR